MRRNKTRQLKSKSKSKKGGARTRQTARKSTAGKPPRMSLTTAPAVRTENENNGYPSNYRNNGENGHNGYNGHNGDNVLRIKELEEKLNAIHDISRL